MKKSEISEAQIIAGLKEHKAGKMATDISGGLGFHQATFYNYF